MSLLDHPDDIEAPNIQVWNNAAFDNGESEFTTLSWSNPSSKSLLTDSSKENLCPVSMNTPASLKHSVSAKQLDRSNGVIDNSLRKPLKLPCIVSAKSYGIKEEEKNIDAEIEETEREISKLSAKLKALRIEKAARTTVHRGERILPIESIEPKLNTKSSDGVKVFESKIGQNRGLSLGPSEIHAGGRLQRQGKTELTPIHGIESRRQSCLPKLVDINEDKAKNRRGNSMSLSPKSRRTLIKAQALRQSATTVVSKRPAKKDGILESIQPKKLFKDIDKLAPPTNVKNQFRTGRVVASRYNQTKESSHVAIENRRQSSSVLCRNKTPLSTVRKRWEIPSEILVHQQEMELRSGQEGD